MVRIWCFFLLLCCGLSDLCAQGALFPVRVNHKWGYISRNGKMQFEPKYDFIGDANLPWNVPQPGLRPVESPFKLVELNGKVGLINAELKEVLPCRYLRIRPLSKLYFAVEMDSLFTVIDTAQRVLLNTRFENICLMPSLKRSQNPYLLVQQGGFWGVSNLKGELLVPVQYKHVEDAGLGYFKYQTERDTVWGLLNPAGKPQFFPAFGDIQVLNDNFIVVSHPDRGRQILKSNGDTLMGRYWERVQQLNKHLVALKPFESDASAELWNLDALVKIPVAVNCQKFESLDNQYFSYSVSGFQMGVMDSIGRKVTEPIYRKVDTIGMAQHFVVTDFKYLKGIIKPGAGEVLPCRYSAIFPYSGHFATCRNTLGWGVINKAFEEVVPCQYNNVTREGNSILRAFNGDYSSVDYYYDQDGKIKGSSRNGKIIQIYFASDNNGDGIVEAQPKQFKEEEDAFRPRNGFADFIASKDSSFAWRENRLAKVWELVQRTDKFKFVPVKDKSVYKHVIEMSPWQTAAVYPMRLCRNAFTRVMGGAFCRMAFWDMENKRYRTPFNMLGCRDFQDGQIYSAFVDTSGQMGLIDREGRQKMREDSTPLRFTYIGRFSNGRARVCTGGEIRFADEQSDEEGKFSLDNQYRFAEEFNMRKPARTLADEGEINAANLIVAPKNGSIPRWGFIDRNGDILLDPVHNFVKDYRKDSLVVFIKFDSTGVGRYGVLNYDFKVTIPAAYDFISSHFQDFKVGVKNPYIFYFNSKGFQIHKCKPPKRNFSEGFCAVSNGYVWGFINPDGKVVIPFQFDSTRNFSGAMAAVVDSSGEWVFIDTLGKHRFSTRIPARYGAWFGRFSEGRCRFKSGKFWGYFDVNGNQAIPAKFVRATEFSFGSAAVSVPAADGPKAAVIDTSGKFIVKPGLYEEISPFDAEGMAVVRAQKSGLYGMINARGDTVIDFKYNQIKPFQNGFAQVVQGKLSGLVNRFGREVMRPQMFKTGMVSEGLVAVLRTENDKRWVYVDTTGREAIRGAYEQVTPFSGGVALINGSRIMDRNGRLGFKAYAFGEGVFCMSSSLNNAFFADAAGNNIFGRVFPGAGPFRFGVAKVFKNNAWGAVNRRGVFVVPAKFKEVFPQPDGNIHVRPKYLYGLVDKTGKQIIEPEYDLLDLYPGGIYRLEQGEQVGYRYRDGAWLWDLQN